MLTWGTSFDTAYQPYPSHNMNQDFLQQSLPKSTTAPMLPVILQQAVDSGTTPIPTPSPQQSDSTQLLDSHMHRRGHRRP
jgi:hypothetical protein